MHSKNLFNFLLLEVISFFIKIIFDGSLHSNFSRNKSLKSLFFFLKITQVTCDNTKRLHAFYFDEFIKKDLEEA